MFFLFYWDADCFLVPKFKNCRDAGVHVCERIFGYSPIPGISLISLTSSHAEGNYLLQMLDSTKGLGHPQARSKHLRPCVNAPNAPVCRRKNVKNIAWRRNGAMALFPNIFPEIRIL